MKINNPGRTGSPAQKSELHEILFRRVNDAILIFEPKTEIILEVSEKACEIYRRKREHFVGRSLKEFSQNPVRGTEELDKLLHDGAYDEFESVHLRGDGVPINMIINAAVIVYRGRKAVLTINRDITDKKATEAALRESEEQFRSVTQSARDAIVSADNRGRIVFWNDAAEKMFGYARDEAIGQSLQIIMPDAHRAAHQTGLERNVATGENHLVGKTVEVPGRRKDGMEFPLELSLGTWESEKGKFFTAVLRDITDRKAAETALEQSERQYRYLAEGIDHQIWTSLPNGKLDYVNQKTLRFLGITMDAMLDDGWANIIHPNDFPMCVKLWEHSLKTGENYEVEFRLKRRDGEYVWHLARSTAGFDTDGKIVKWFGTNTDIDDKKRAETEIQKNLSLLNSTFEATADGVLVVNADNRIEMFNRQFAEMWGVTDEELKNLSSASVPQIVLDRIKKPSRFH